jgi:hypothetical protein
MHIIPVRKVNRTWNNGHYSYFWDIIWTKSCTLQICMQGHTQDSTLLIHQELQGLVPFVVWGGGPFFGQGMKLTTHLRLVLRSRKHGDIPPLSQNALIAWCYVKARGRPYLTFTFIVTSHKNLWTIHIINMSHNFMLNNLYCKNCH